MAFVEHDQAEAWAQVIHVKHGRVVSRNGELLNVVLATSDDAYGHSKGRFQQIEPLTHEVECGRNHESAAPLVGDRKHGQVALS
jgi:hypothetical protein